jgi:hypothetical protein
MFQQVSQYDQVNPSDFETRIKTVENEIIVVLGEAIDRMKEADIPLQVYNSRGSRLANIARNLFWNWMHVKQATQEFPQLVRAHKYLQFQHDVIEDLYHKALTNKSTLDGFRDGEMHTKTEALLDSLCDDVTKDGDPSELGKQVQNLSATLLSVIQDWKNLMIRLETLVAEAERDGNQVVYDAVDHFLVEVREVDNVDEKKQGQDDAGEEERPAVEYVEDDKLKKKITVIFAVCCLYLFTVFVDLLELTL